jgi:hypothetical protein
MWWRAETLTCGRGHYRLAGHLRSCELCARSATRRSHLTGAGSPLSPLRGGREDVYVAAFPRYDGRRRVSVAGGAWPRWNRDGGEVFYLDPENQLMAASVGQAATDLGVATPRALFRLRARLDRGYPYDVSADGQRVLVSVVGRVD